MKQINDSNNANLKGDINKQAKNNNNNNSKT